MIYDYLATKVALPNLCQKSKQLLLCFYLHRHLNKIVHHDDILLSSTNFQREVVQCILYNTW